ncbi:MAG: beta-lactamase [Burkholderiales bacterium]|nr:beta-lactamase [Burkholderiales bacterium]
MFAKLALAAASTFFIAAGCYAAESDAQRPIAAAIESAILPVMQQHNIPGFAVAVTLDGKRHYFNYGVASRHTRQAVTRDTLFEVGSISKTFTATLAAYAQESGAISMNAYASQYLPSLRGSSFDNISLLDLGTYASGGLPLQFPDGVSDSEKMIGYFKNWKPTFAAGTRRLYSNPSIGLFGYLAAKGMGVPFVDLMETRIFPKLGLTRTFINVPDDQMQHYAHGYTKEDKPIRVRAGLLDAEAYGVKSSATDMIHFVEVNMKGVGLETRMQRAISATHAGYFTVGTMTQGLGWEMYAYPIALKNLQEGNSSQMLYEANAVTRLNPPRPLQANVLINKTGSTNGFGAYVAFVPCRRIGVVLLANKNYPITARVKAAFEILKALDGQLGEESAAGASSGSKH